MRFDLQWAAARALGAEQHVARWLPLIGQRDFRTRPAIVRAAFSSAEVVSEAISSTATKIFKGRERKVNERYAALASHYAFDPLFCMPASGNEKPYVENFVFDLQRRWATPVPRVKGLAELNTHLRACCFKERERIVAGQSESIAQRFTQDQVAASRLAGHRFDPCIPQAAQVDKYQTVRFDGNRYYRVPRPCGQGIEQVTVATLRCPAPFNYSLAQAGPERIKSKLNHA